jgi:hypothetical protein
VEGFPGANPEGHDPAEHVAHQGCRPMGVGGDENGGHPDATHGCAHDEQASGGPPALGGFHARIITQAGWLGSLAPGRGRFCPVALVFYRRPGPG